MKTMKTRNYRLTSKEFEAEIRLAKTREQVRALLKNTQSKDGEVWISRYTG